MNKSTQIIGKLGSLPTSFPTNKPSNCRDYGTKDLPAHSQTIASLSLKSLISAYLCSAEWQALRPSTKTSYLQLLKQWEARVSGREFVSNSTVTIQNAMQLPVAVASDVAYFSQILSSFNGTQNQRAARRMLTALFGWGMKYQLWNVNYGKLLPMPKLTARPRSPFTVEEIRAIAAHFTAIEPRLRPYISEAVVAFHTGMRPTELENLVWDDVGPDYIKVRSAKAHEVGAVARLLKVTEGVAKALPARGEGLVFKSMTGKKLNKDTRSEAIRVACRLAGIQEREFYNTRRGTATEMYKQNYGIVDIQHQLGHANIQTTQIYIKPSMQDKANKFRGF